MLQLKWDVGYATTKECLHLLLLSHIFNACKFAYGNWLRVGTINVQA